MQRPVTGRGVLLESCVEPGRFVVPQKAGDGDVLLKLLPVCANASCTAEASRFSFDEAVGNLGGEGGERGRGRPVGGGGKRGAALGECCLVLASPSRGGGGVRQDEAPTEGPLSPGSYLLAHR